MGLPLAGKSSWIEEANLFGYSVVSADKIKEEHPDYKPESAYKLHDYSVTKAEQEMNSISNTGVNIVMDGGGINNSYTIRIINMLKSKGYSVKLVHIKTPLSVCIERNKIRERKVPESEIIDKSKKENDQFNRLIKIVDDYEVVKYFNYNKINN